MISGRGLHRAGQNLASQPQASPFPGPSLKMAFFMAIFCCFERLDDQRERAGSGRLCQETDESSTRYNTRHASSGSASQRNVLEQLRAALAQAIERIIATCPTAVPTVLTERLNAIQHRIWAMHDAHMDASCGGEYIPPAQGPVRPSRDAPTGQY